MNTDEISDQTYESMEFGERDLEEKRLEGCRFLRCRLSGISLTKTRFIGCEFSYCDLSLMRATGTTFRDCHFVECKAVGVAWNRASGLHSVRFERCKLSDGCMAGMDLRHLSFDGSHLENMDFEGTRLDKASLRDCLLRGARFQKTSLVEADLSHASEVHLDPRNNRCRNTRMTIPEALGVLQLLGITC